MAQAKALRPMGLLEIVDQTFRLYRSNFWLFFGIAAIAYLPFVALLALLVIVDAAPSSALAGTAIIPLLPLLLAVVALWLLMSGALAKAVSDRYLGYETTIAGAYGHVGKRLGSFFVTLLLTGLFVVSGVILLWVGSIVFFFWAGFVVEVFIIEGKRYFQAIWRSRFLVGHGVWAELVVLAVITGLLSLPIRAAILLPVALLGASTSHVGLVSVANAFASALGLALVLPITVVAMILLYYDSRIRKEGFDLETLARELGKAAPVTASSAPAPSAAAPPAPTQPPDEERV